MNEIQQFLFDKSVKPYGVGMFTASDAIDFVKLCMQSKTPIYGIDGFYKRVDKSPGAIQIDQGLSTNYSNVAEEEAYKLALGFLEEKKRDEQGAVSSYLRTYHPRLRHSRKLSNTSLN